MGVDYYQILFIGVKLDSRDEFFRLEKKEDFGCPHEEKVHPYCPECGQKSKWIHQERVPIVPLNDEDDRGAPRIDNRFYLWDDPHGYQKEVYIGVYLKMIDSDGKAHFLSPADTTRLLNECADMVNYLREKGINVKDENIGIYSIPYVSY